MSTTLANVTLSDSLFPFHTYQSEPMAVNVSSPEVTCIWTAPQHYLFQMANGVLLGAVACPGGKHGTLFMHSCFVLGMPS